MQESIGINICDLGLANGLFDMTPKHKQQNKKIDQLDIIKIKNFCDWKDIKKVKMQPKYEKNLQTIYLIKNLCQEYIKNYYNSIVKWHIAI